MCYNRDETLFDHQIPADTRVQGPMRLKFGQNHQTNHRRTDACISTIHDTRYTIRATETHDGCTRTFYVLRSTKREEIRVPTSLQRRSFAKRPLTLLGPNLGPSFGGFRHDVHCECIRTDHISTSHHTIPYTLMTVPALRVQCSAAGRAGAFHLRAPRHVVFQAPSGRAGLWKREDRMDGDRRDTMTVRAGDPDRCVGGCHGDA